MRSDGCALFGFLARFATDRLAALLTDIAFDMTQPHLVAVCAMTYFPFSFSQWRGVKLDCGDVKIVFRKSHNLIGFD